MGGCTLGGDDDISSSETKLSNNTLQMDQIGKTEKPEESIPIVLPAWRVGCHQIPF